MKSLNRIPLYPLILGLYPVLFLWLVNFTQVPSGDILGSLWISLALTAFTCLLAALAFRKLHKAAAAAGLFLSLFFFYGHFYNLVVGQKFLGFLVGTPPITLSLWGLLFIFGLFFIIRTPSNMVRATGLFNQVGAFMLLLTMGQLALRILPGMNSPAPMQLPADPSPITTAQIQPAGDAPDVYYIVLDGYDRQDLLKNDMNVDNQPFITQLEELGFVVPACTQSNYNATTFSVAATLTMNYLDRLGSSYANLAIESDVTVEKSTPTLVTAIQGNPVMQQFKKMGYQIITLEQDYPFLNFPTSDIVLDNRPSIQAKMITLKFQSMFLKTTLLQRLIQNMEAAPEKFAFLPEWVNEIINPNIALNQKYQKDLFQLQQLDQITEIPGKKFLYAHLMVTHPDFAFTRTGELRESSLETRAAYGDQVLYANQRILTLVENILDQSSTPPIIILQGDHGYGYGGRGSEQFKILNAYYLPGDAEPLVSATITPVNTFRLILSHYFQKNYPPLPDQSIWIHPDFPNGYQKIPGSCIQP